jgi:uncharacterized membrane protein
MTLPPEIITMLIAMLPVFELNVAVPTGVFLGLPIEGALFWGIIGNMVPIFFNLLLLGPVSTFLMKHFKVFKWFFTKIFDFTRKRHSKKFEEIGAIFLITLIAIPMPGAGAWSASLLAFLFDIPFWRAILYIFLGVVASGIVISLGIGTITQIPGLVNYFVGK